VVAGEDGEEDESEIGTEFGDEAAGDGEEPKREGNEACLSGRQLDGVILGVVDVGWTSGRRLRPLPVLPPCLILRR
jgi:hypothetical protein